MYKLSVPVSMNTLTEETFPVYMEWFRKCKVHRVFICGFGHIYAEDSVLNSDPKRVEKAIRYFQSQGLEVGAWVCSLGHGMILAQDKKEQYVSPYTPIEGVLGDTVAEAICPLDEDFVTDYQNAIRKLASFHPDMIMLDDDFRMNVRPYYMGCFCPLHLKEYYKRIGEEIPREELESLLFTGGKNKYRSAYMELMKDTVLDFAKGLRQAVDEVDDTIRLGAAGSPDNIDFSGTDLLEIARAFAGKTEPFTRTIGAPYWRGHLSAVVDDSRMEMSWYKNQGVEVFTEGDSYPRPRYNVSAKVLELFDFLLIADGNTDGILKYMFDYVQKPDYEEGYADMHVRRMDIREGIFKLFEGKVPTGVEVYSSMHKVENWDLSEVCPDKIVTKLARHGYRSHAGKLLSQNSIPSAYGKTDYPILLCGENARYVQEEDLKNGAVLDVVAARILGERGVDVGLISEEDATFVGEYFPTAGDTVRGFKEVALKKIACSPKAKIQSTFVPDETPASYTYENAKGQRFYVLAHDNFMSEACPNYFNNYYRQAELVETIEWLGGKKLPATCMKHPNLYILAAIGQGALSVALANMFQDDIFEPVIQLDREYQEIQFLNCSGQLKGDKVYLSDVGPYQFVAFEVK